MNAAWMPLPDDLPEPARRLTEHLRAVKDAHQLSLAELAKATHFSKASWERWLNGKRLITEQGLDALVAAVDCDAVLLRAMLEQASAAADDAPRPAGRAEARVEARTEARVEAEALPVTEPEPDPASGRSVPLLRRPLLWGSAAAAVLVAAVCVLWLSPWSGSTGSAPHVITAKTPDPATSAPFCTGIGCAGKDPQSTGCGTDVRTLQTANDGKVILYVHYSARCQAAWAALTDGAPGDTATITTSTGQQETALIHWGYDNYSAMVDASDPRTALRVCGVQPAGRACTSTLNAPTLNAPSAVPRG
ncbi:transcriptional regulator with XRE-family HTH domain [Streptacidiphilus sp. MAP12-16]|uniref:DUF2690 domain-containing protein n=1 Tax=Streptacidiphilus sp. MAP12-16 TaxID=3156300 RepID=UPI0035166E1F